MNSPDLPWMPVQREPLLMLYSEIFFAQRASLCLLIFICLACLYHLLSYLLIYLPFLYKGNTWSSKCPGPLDGHPTNQNEWHASVKWLIMYFSANESVVHGLTAVCKCM